MTFHWRTLLFATMVQMGLGLVCEEPGICYGSLVEKLDTPGFASCLKACQDNPECWWYTFDALDHYCGLLSTCDTLDPSCSTCQSGQKECETQYECNLKQRCPGAPLTESITTNSYYCAEECHNTNGCTWLTYNKRNQSCLLFDECEIQGLNPSPDLVTEESACYSAGSHDKPYLVIGLGLFDNASSTVLDAETLEHECTLPQFPWGSGALGGASIYFQDALRFCKGQYFDGCFQFYADQGHWDLQDDNLFYGREYPSSVVTSEGWLVLGGDAGTFASEVMKNGEETFSTGPSYPKSVTGECAVQVSPSQTMMIGGSRSPDSMERTTFLYDWTNGTEGQWMPKSKFLLGRMYHSCGLYKNPDTNKDEVIMVGGVAKPYPDEPAFNTTLIEIYDVEEDSWRSALFGFETFHARFVNLGDRLILAEGTDLYEYTPNGFTSLGVSLPNRAVLSVFQVVPQKALSHC